ncbi:MAG: hypothetical protein BGN91_14305 [Nitrobacter sp. 62-13]|uniref:hypothetical protein n=1 Tax=Nitrobacter sp. 62-13 TaxID=1895797 RepID=UPI0009697BD3|nr:hypothetical protein [Nitrobacter sp. 62-13]OJU29517.1 MAG: hypothetical protein BGN91_14305 [Nitrobacter sp. 62-13]
MATNSWRISTVNGALLALYFIPAWTMVAFKIMVSPVYGLYDLPNVSVALFLSDHMHLTTVSMVRMAWFLALGKITVVAFFAVFLVMTMRASVRKSGGCDEALALALGIGSLITFGSMVMASRVGEMAALRLHATELLLLVGGAILMAIEQPFQRDPAPMRQWPPQPDIYPFGSSGS